MYEDFREKLRTNKREEGSTREEETSTERERERNDDPRSKKTSPRPMREKRSKKERDVDRNGT